MSVALSICQPHSGHTKENPFMKIIADKPYTFQEGHPLPIWKLTVAHRGPQEH